MQEFETLGLQTVGGAGEMETEVAPLTDQLNIPMVVVSAIWLQSSVRFAAGTSMALSFMFLLVGLSAFSGTWREMGETAPEL